MIDLLPSPFSYFVWTLLFFSLIAATRAASGEVNSGAAFLKIPVGARAAGMGQAFTALAQDMESLDWNAAGLLKTSSNLDSSNFGLSISHQSLFLDTSMNNIGFVRPAQAGSSIAWGFSLTRLSYGSFERRDENRKVVGSYNASDTAAILALARDLGRFSMGSGIKFIRMEIDGDTAQGMAVDFGMMSGTPIPRLSLGAAIRNLGPPLKFNRENVTLPLTFSLGTAYSLTPSLSIALDVLNRPHQNQTALAIGSELVAMNSFSLRAGYLAKLAEAITNTQTSETRDDGRLNGINAGMGVRFGQFALDYSISPFGELGNTHNLTVSTWFGAKERTEVLENAPANQEIESGKPLRGPRLELNGDKESWWERLK